MKKPVFIYVLFMIMFILSFSISCKVSDKSLATVEKVDLEKYSGTWYEIATIPASFQKGCSCTLATYTPKKEYVQVYNTCLKEGKVKDIKGKAFPVEASNNAQLQVQFFWPFKGDYYIIALDTNYQWAMIGEPARKYFWILSRSKQMEEGLYNDLLKKAKEQFGYDTGLVVKTDQNCD